jgi:hypothetical protein
VTHVNILGSGPYSWTFTESSDKGQTLLGEDASIDSLADHLKRQKDIPEIPKNQALFQQAGTENNIQ